MTTLVHPLLKSDLVAPSLPFVILVGLAFLRAELGAI